jgi:hypothetical protein
MAPPSRPFHLAGDSRWLEGSVAEPAALTSGYRLLFAIGASLVLVALVFAGTVLKPVEEAEEEALRARDRPLGDAILPASRVR